MSVFVSWSGDRSKRLAQALMPLVSGAVPGLDVWMSEQDIQAGARWSDALNRTLESSDFGVLCLTPENLNAPWLLFEAGSLAKSVSGSKVVPYRLGLAPDEISLPLAQFQGVDANESGTWHLVKSLGGALSSGPSEDQLLAAFKASWPPLESAIALLLASAPPAAVREIDQERRRAQAFCARVAGFWWERIPGEGLGFFRMQLDELHNSVQLTDGRFYSESGDLVAYFNSAVARIDEENSRKGIVYLRECRDPLRDGKNWFHGYGDMWFDGSVGAFNQGHGTFFDVNRDDPGKTLANEVDLRRVPDADKVGTMMNGTATDRRALVQAIVSTW